MRNEDKNEAEKWYSVNKGFLICLIHVYLYVFYVCDSRQNISDRKKIQEIGILLKGLCVFSIYILMFTMLTISNKICHNCALVSFLY